MGIDFWEVYTTMRKLESDGVTLLRENEALKKRVAELEAEVKKKLKDADGKHKTPT